jgi:hypothetical protein
LPHQIIKQIVKITLPSDVVQLQPGRKPKKGARKVKGVGRPRAPRAPRAPRKPKMVPRAPSAPSTLPKAPDGFLSQTFGAPPQPFLQTAQSFYEKQRQEQQDRLLAKALKKIEKEEYKETLKEPTVSVSAPSVISPVVQPSVSLKQAMQPRPIIIPQPSPGLSRLPARGSVAERYVRSRSREYIELGQGKVPGFRVSGSLWGITSPIIAEEIPRPPPLRGAPNQANQPSVDVNGEGKEAEILQPQTPAISLAQASQPIRRMKVESVDASPVSSQASSSSTEDIISEILRLRKREYSARDPYSQQKKRDTEARIQTLERQLKVDTSKINIKRRVLPDSDEDE